MILEIEWVRALDFRENHVYISRVIGIWHAGLEMVPPVPCLTAGTPIRGTAAGSFKPRDVAALRGTAGEDILEALLRVVDNKVLEQKNEDWFDRKTRTLGVCF